MSKKLRLQHTRMAATMANVLLLVVQDIANDGITNFRVTVQFPGIEFPAPSHIAVLDVIKVNTPSISDGRLCKRRRVHDSRLLIPTVARAIVFERRLEESAEEIVRHHVSLELDVISLLAEHIDGGCHDASVVEQHGQLRLLLQKVLGCILDGVEVGEVDDEWATCLAGVRLQFCNHGVDLGYIPASDVDVGVVGEQCSCCVLADSRRGACDCGG